MRRVCTVNAARRFCFIAGVRHFATETNAAVQPVNVAFPNSSRTTLWRWRELGWLQTVNIAGRQYVTPEAVAEFKRRAADGDFAKVHKTPKRAVAA
jgi:hypothetical protein